MFINWLVASDHFSKGHQVKASWVSLMQGTKNNNKAPQKSSLPQNQRSWSDKVSREFEYVAILQPCTVGLDGLWILVQALFKSLKFQLN